MVPKECSKLGAVAYTKGVSQGFDEPLRLPPPKVGVHFFELDN